MNVPPTPEPVPPAPPPDVELAACRARLAALQREMDAFTYAVAHDLRAPLRAVTGFLDALREDHSRDLPPAGQSYLLRAIEVSARAQRMLEALLRLNRLAQQPLDRRPTPLGEIADQVRREAMRAAAGRDVRWQVGALPEVFADRRLLHEALGQLVANALKFTRNCPCATIELRVEEGAQGQVFSVRDNGAGFNAAAAANLGEPFARFHGQQEFDGIGAGLAITLRILRRHGGRLWAESREGEGATFYFTLASEADGGRDAEVSPSENREERER